MSRGVTPLPDANSLKRRHQILRSPPLSNLSGFSTVLVVADSRANVFVYRVCVVLGAPNSTSGCAAASWPNASPVAECIGSSCVCRGAAPTAAVN